MKKVILFALLIPNLSLGQRCEITEMMGYGYPFPSKFYSYAYPYNFRGGFSNQVVFDYYLKKHITLGAFYELNVWNPNNSSFGLKLESHSKHFYIGANIADVFVNTSDLKVEDWGVKNTIHITYSPSVSLGVHMGLKQKIAKNIFLNEQIGFTTSLLKGKETSPQFNNIGPVTFPNGPFSETLEYVNILVGVSYRL